MERNGHLHQVTWIIRNRNEIMKDEITIEELINVLKLHIWPRISSFHFGKESFDTFWQARIEFGPNARHETEEELMNERSVYEWNDKSERTVCTYKRRQFIIFYFSFDIFLFLHQFVAAVTLSRWSTACKRKRRNIYKCIYRCAGSYLCPCGNQNNTKMMKQTTRQKRPESFLVWFACNGEEDISFSFKVN